MDEITIVALGLFQILNIWKPKLPKRASEVLRDILNYLCWEFFVNQPKANFAGMEFYNSQSFTSIE